MASMESNPSRNEVRTTYALADQNDRSVVSNSCGIALGRYGAMALWEFTGCARRKYYGGKVAASATCGEDSLQQPVEKCRLTVTRSVPRFKKHLLLARDHDPI